MSTSHVKISTARKENGCKKTLDSTTTGSCDDSFKYAAAIVSKEFSIEDDDDDEEDESGRMTPPTESSESDPAYMMSPAQLEEYPPMPEERIARKQRTVMRRGGAGHSALLRSAVLAAMEYSENEFDDEDRARAMGHNMQGPASPASVFLPESVFLQEGRKSPRKRARRILKTEDLRVEEAAISAASNLLGTLNVVDETNPEAPTRRAPVRRVSRRTSYDERPSASAEEEEIDLEGDEKSS